MSMVQRKFYLPAELYNRLQIYAKVAGQTITGVLRELVDEGLKLREKTPKGRGTKALLELARMAEREGYQGPSDLAEKHNQYFVETWKAKEKRIKKH